MKPPEIKLTPDGVVGMYEFELWAFNNVPLWRSAMNYGAKTGCGYEEIMKFLAAQMCVENEKLKAEAVKTLQRSPIQS